MKWIVSILICMLSLLTIHTRAQSLVGTWTLEQCELRQDSAGVISTIDYRLSDGNIPKWYVFIELTFSEEKFCYIILNNEIKKGEYSLMDDGMLELDFKVMIPVYHYILISDTTLVLMRRHYLYNESNPERGFIDIKMSYSKK